MSRSLYLYQEKIVDATWAQRGHALFMEMGTGKTTVVTETAKRLFTHDFIDRVCVVAPKTVCGVWTRSELPALDIPPESILDYLSTPSTKKRKIEKDLVPLPVGEENGLSWLVIHYDALITQKGFATIDQFIGEGSSCLLILDESHRVKNPKAKRTKRALSLSERAKYCRILSGTSISQSPFDLYTQYKMLNPHFWTPLYSCRSYFDFQRIFGCFKQRYAGTHSFSECTGYQRLDVLSDFIHEHTTYVRLSDVWLDLPQKIYETRFVNMSRLQAKYYHKKMHVFDDIDSYLGMNTNVLHLQLLASGHYRSSTNSIALFDNTKNINPKIQALLDIDSDYPTDKQGIIFTRFRCELEDVVSVLGAENCAILQGDMQDVAKDRSIFRFTSGACRWMVANITVGSLGLNLQKAGLIIFYGHTWSYAERRQAEARLLRLGQQARNVLFIDILTQDTVDIMIKESLMEKQNFSVEIFENRYKMGD